jgi:hypothetical protein
MKIIKVLIKATQESTSCSIGLTTQLIVFLLAVPFAATPSGTSIRPMGWAMLVFMVGALAFFLGALSAIVDVMSGKRVHALIGFVLCASTFFAASGWLHLIAILKGFTLAD